MPELREQVLVLRTSEPQQELVLEASASPVWGLPPEPEAAWPVSFQAWQEAAAGLRVQGRPVWPQASGRALARELPERGQVPF